MGTISIRKQELEQKITDLETTLHALKQELHPASLIAAWIVLKSTHAHVHT